MKSVTINQYKKETGLSRKRIMGLIESNSLNAVMSDGGHYKILLEDEETSKVAELLSQTLDINAKLDRLISIFNV